MVGAFDHHSDRALTKVRRIATLKRSSLVWHNSIFSNEWSLHQFQGSSSEAIGSLIGTALSAYRTEHRTSPARVLVHKTSTFDQAETSGCLATVDGAQIDTLELLTLRSSQTRLFRRAVYPPLRGTFVTLDSDTHLLYTRGSVDFFSAYPGLYVPHPLEVRIGKVESAARSLAEEILALSKMNWNNTQFDGAWPITLRAAKQVAAILRQCPEGVPIQARYAFYM